MSEIKDYGEPWELATRRINGEDVLAMETITGTTIAYDLRIEHMDRALACVNAMQGRDPAKLERLVKAVRATLPVMASLIDPSMISKTDIMGAYAGVVGAECNLRNALAAFEGRQP